MNGWVKVYHYLGSTRFLVAVLALCVAVVCFNLFTQSAVVPGTFALCIEGKNGTHVVSMEGWESPLKWSVNDPIFSIGALQGALLKGVSNSKQRLRCCHENQLHLSAYDNRDFFHLG